MAYNDGFATAWYPTRDESPIYADNVEDDKSSSKKKKIILVTVILLVVAAIAGIVAAAVVLTRSPPPAPAAQPRFVAPLTSMEIEGDMSLLGQTYDDKMNTSGTPEYEALNKDVCDLLKNNSEGNGLVNATNCQVTNVSPGSIRIRYRMTFVKFEGVTVSDSDCMKKVGRHTVERTKRCGHLKNHGYVYSRSCRFQSMGACSPNPCTNGGKCINKGDSYECQCSGGHTGNKCQIKPEWCYCSGDPHCHTFDGAKMDFQGTCRYTLVEALDGSFKISGRNVRLQANAKVAFARWIEIKAGGTKVRLGKLSKKKKVPTATLR